MLQMKRVVYLNDFDIQLWTVELLREGLWLHPSPPDITARIIVAGHSGIFVRVQLMGYSGCQSNSIRHLRSAESWSLHNGRCANS